MPEKPPVRRPHLVTAALPYANGPLHIGHLAGAYLPADIYARYLRNQGTETLFLCGSDEGGVAILLQAKKEGIDPQTLVDKYHDRNKKAFEHFGISFDLYTRTSNPIHHQTAQAFFLELYNQGKLIQRTTEQYYDPQENIFLADRYIQGTCPHCGYDEAYGDQCEKCGTSLSSEELLHPTSRISGTTPLLKQTTHWYLPLQEYAPWLKKWILQDHADWKPNVLGQCKAWLHQGLQPRAITRDLDWGVPVPLPNLPSKVLYVWFEAPLGYLSATKEWAQAHGKDWAPYWKDDCQIVHFVGKDNIVFHCIIFPAMLKAHGGYNLPTYVPANEFMNLEGAKISTSRQHAVWLEDYLTQYPNQQDLLRYTLCANAPEAKDSNFTWADFRRRTNEELVATFGNFVHRTLSLAQRYTNNQIPTPEARLPIDKELISNVRQLQKTLEQAIETFHFRKAQNQLMELARLGNRYLADTEPWKLATTHPTRMATTLYLALQLVARLARLCEPFLPFTSKKMQEMLQLPPGSWPPSKPFSLLAPQHPLGTIQLLFEKLEET